MITCLPMYDWPELRTEHYEFWCQFHKQLQQAGIASPQHLSHELSETCCWKSPQLLLGQTCGYPLATNLKNKVQYVATPHYDVRGCDDARYSSYLIANKSNPVTLDGLSGKKFAFNGQASLSGYRTVGQMLGEPEKIFAQCMESGGHRNSAQMVAIGKADIAAIDAVCWHWLHKFEPGIADQLYEVSQCPMLPALPYITSLETSEATLNALREILVDIKNSDTLCNAASSLAITGFSVLNLDEYQQLENY